MGSSVGDRSESGTKGFLVFSRPFRAWKHIQDHMMRLFTKLKVSKTLPVAAAQARVCVSTAYRFGHDPRMQAHNGQGVAAGANGVSLGTFERDLKRNLWSPDLEPVEL